MFNTFKNLKIGLFFGSFNPIHVGHLIIASSVLNHSDLDEVWLVVSPQNPLKKKSSLLNDYHRLEMAHLALENYINIKPCDIEFKLPKPSYTIDSLVYLKEKYPKFQFSLIMGSDNLKSLHKWKNYQQIIEKNPIIVYPRHKYDINQLEKHKTVQLITQVPNMEISSTLIRQLIKDKKEFKAFLPQAVYQFIEKGNHYG